MMVQRLRFLALRFMALSLCFSIFIVSPVHAEGVGAATLPDSPFTRALKARSSFRKLGYESCGLSKDAFFHLALFIESSLDASIKNGQYYLKKEETGLACTIDYDPMTEQVFIVLPESQNNYLGRGAHKIVTKALLYMPDGPKLVARALQKKKISNEELEMTQLFGNSKGHVHLLAHTEHKNNEKSSITMYTELYNSGSLVKVLYSKEKFSLFEKMKIAKNLLSGLQTMHEKGIVHRDIAPHNCMIHISNGVQDQRDIAVVLGDLGRAKSLATPFEKKMRVQGHTAYTPPEGIFFDEMKDDDFYASDVYALGVVLYELFYEQFAPWKNAALFSAQDEPKDLRYAQLVSHLHYETEKRRLELALKADVGSATCSDVFEYMILQMVDPAKERRGSAKTHLETIDRALGQVVLRFEPCESGDESEISNDDDNKSWE